MFRALLGITLTVITITELGIAQKTDEQDIDRLFLDLKQTLVKRSVPDGLLLPSLTPSRREQESQKAIRPYVTIEFKYNLADLQREGTKARLPLIIEYETARATSRLTGTARLEKVGNSWYFADFDFMTFPWALVIGGCAVGFAFSLLILYLYKRSTKRRATAAG